MGRECKVLVGAGKKGVGKTVETVRMLDEIVMGNPYEGIAPRKVLILDVNDEYSDFWFFNNPHRKIKALAIKDIPLFTISNFCEIRRIRPFFDDGRKMSLDDMADTLAYILSVYRCGTLVCEDPSKYISDSLKQDLIGALCTARHLSIDLILHYQSIGKVGHPKLFANTDYIRMHKVNDSVSRHETKFQDKTELFMIAENIVNHKYYEEGKKRFFLFIDNGESKIKAGEDRFTQKDIDRAIYEYISTKWQSLVKPYTHRINPETRKKMYPDTNSILDMLSKKLKSTYFDE